MLGSHPKQADTHIDGISSASLRAACEQLEKIRQGIGLLATGRYSMSIQWTKTQAAQHITTGSLLKSSKDPIYCQLSHKI